MPSDAFFEVAEAYCNEIIRFEITGGEPLLHPDIEMLLALPEKLPSCGFVLQTNGSLRPDLDDQIVGYNWSIGVSLHGREQVHNAYTGSDSFGIVARRIDSLTREGLVHIYTVLHDELDAEDIDWLVRFRDDVGAKFLRFIVPRKYGRFQPLLNQGLVREVKALVDSRMGVKISPSRTRFVTVDGQMRRSN